MLVQVFCFGIEQSMELGSEIGSGRTTVEQPFSESSTELPSKVA